MHIMANLVTYLYRHFVHGMNLAIYKKLCTCTDYLIQSDINKNKIIILFYNTLWIKTGDKDDNCKKANILRRYKT